LKRNAIATLGLIIAITTAHAADTQTSDIDISIRYLDKKIYYAGINHGPVQVELTIANRGASDYRFKLAQDRVFSMDFEVRTLQNRPVAVAQSLLRKRSGDQPAFFRDVHLAPGESFSLAEDLRSYVDLDNPGSYVVRAKFYPDLYRAEGAPSAGDAEKSMAFFSNRLSLSIHPEPRVDKATGFAPSLDADTGVPLARAPIAPDGVVEYTLTARQKGQWEKFFLYLDLESMMLRDAARRRTWAVESEEGRLRMLSRYREELQAAKVDSDIYTIPVEFSIERTAYTPLEGSVSVLEKFRYGTLTERKRYVYDVAKKDGVWTIIGYTVTNLGTE